MLDNLHVQFSMGITYMNIILYIIVYTIYGQWVIICEFKLKARRDIFLIEYKVNHFKIIFLYNYNLKNITKYIMNANLL